MTDPDCRSVIKAGGGSTVSYKGEEIVACYDADITALVPKTGTAKRLKRWEKEQVLDAAEAFLKKNPDAMRQRKRLIEHPYGTIKHWMGSTHFLMKRLPNVQAEMSLHVLTYNLRRAINILGVPKIMEQLTPA